MLTVNDFEIGSRLKMIRESYRAKDKPDKKMGQVEFAKEIGLYETDNNDNSQMSKWENGNARPSLEALVTYSEKCGVSLDEIIKGSVEDQIKTVQKSAVPTYAEVAVMIRDLVRNDAVSTDNFYLKGAEGLDEFAVTVKDPVIRYILEEYNKLESLRKSDTISDEIFDTWEKGFLDRLNYAVLDWSKFYIDEGFRDILKRLSFGLDDMKRNSLITAMQRTSKALEDGTLINDLPF